MISLYVSSCFYDQKGHFFEFIIFLKQKTYFWNKFN